jgi:hypothetical protein
MRFVKDLLFTDKYLIKGHVNTGGQRLSTFLNNTRKRFLEMEEAIFIRHDGGDRIQTEWALVHVNEVLFAHEMEQTGDEGLRNLAARDRAEIAVTIHLRWDAPMHLSGMVHKRAMHSDALHHHDFVVMINPILQGFTVKPAPEYALLQNVPYLIVNRERIALIFRRLN